MIVCSGPRPASVRRRLGLSCVLGFTLLLTLPVAAEPGKNADIGAKRDELARLQSQITLSEETLARIKGEIQSLNADSTKLKMGLVRSAGAIQDREKNVLTADARLRTLASQELDAKAALLARRGVLVEVLASLQRMDHRQPPALLVEPEDALSAVRSSILLGSILPQIRGETQKLAEDLTRVAELRRAITEEREGMKRELVNLAEERERTALLIIERQKTVAAQRKTFDDEQRKVAALAREAASLKDLVARMEREIASAEKAAAAANLLVPHVISLHPQSPLLADPGRTAPALAFEQAQGLLPLPVVGKPLRNFGQNDGLGGLDKGLVLSTEPMASVIAPCDGWVVYAGPFRSYGQLLIINAGSGYHVVLAGMDKINVELGQFLLTGEPVAVMGTGEATQIAGLDAPSGAQVGQPALYIEFRKGSMSIDPTPWWAKQSEKARG